MAPLFRRRNGLCNTRSLLLAVIICLCFYTFLGLRSKPVDPLVDDLHDVEAQDTDTNHSKHIATGFGVRKGDGSVALGKVEVIKEAGNQEQQEVLSTASKQVNAMVVASQRSENTTWLDRFFPEWNKWIYHVDEPEAKLTVPKNKGRESMVYLTFIIDNYEDLPDNVLFIHPTRFQWHNDDPDYDGLPMLRKFQLPYLQKEGYVNMRCAWVLGCPAEIKPLEQEGHHRTAIHAGENYRKGFEQLFPGKEVPAVVGASCCAQFAVTKAKIRERPKSDYEHYRNWLLETELEDAISGRIFEYSWHMIFGKKPVHCPNAEQCYCNVFGLCNLNCNEESCEGRYELPRFSSLPDGWPARGWEGEERKVSTTDY